MRTFSPTILALADASSFAPRENALFFTLVGVSAVVVALLAVANTLFLVQYRRGAQANRAPLRVATWKVEATWITATTVIFLGFFFWGARLYLDMQRAPVGAAEVSVIARQWMWDTRYPSGRREFNALHVAVGQPVRLALSSEDVIHSFFVPAFRVKQDVVPGKLVSTWFTPTRTGDYPLYCTQYCGSAHSLMTGHVVVMGPAAYAAWLGSPPAGGQLVAAGARLYAQFACARCHDTEAAPRLAGLAGQVVRLADGTFVRADESFLHDAILAPARVRVAGYPPVMPDYHGAISESDVIALIAYLRGRPAPVPTPGLPSLP